MWSFLFKLAAVWPLNSGNVNTIIPTSMVAAETKLQDFATKPLPSVGTDVASLSDRATRLGLGD